jgi:hypothetical protein
MISSRLDQFVYEIQSAQKVDKSNKKISAQFWQFDSENARRAGLPRQKVAGKQSARLSCRKCE